MKRLTKHGLIQKLRVSIPFTGSDQSWKTQYGENWEIKKLEYITLCNNQKENILSKY